MCVVGGGGVRVCVYTASLFKSKDDKECLSNQCFLALVSRCLVV